MKRLTCKELDGVCDAEITGNTPDEMAKNSREHAMSQDDEAHKNRMMQMREMLNGPDAVKKYMDDFRAKFDALPDA
jgi:hypothetical protein